MLIQYLSDIHLECYEEGICMAEYESFIEVAAPYLVLAGDIGVPGLPGYEAFLIWCSQRWKKIFIIAGNHEFYNDARRLQKTLKKPENIVVRLAMMRQLCKKISNIHFLECDSVYLAEENTRVIGCTLWATFDGIRNNMNDESLIYMEGDTKARLSDLKKIHWLQIAWLNQEITKSSLTGEKLLVISHYLPTYDLIAEMFRDNKNNNAYASHSDELIRAPVAAWICGHSHSSVELVKNGVNLCMNPWGYPDEEVTTRNRQATIMI